jgi:hypothetical protein
MTTLRRDKRQFDRRQFWVVLGPQGAISWVRLLVETGYMDGPIDIHSPKPLYPQYKDMSETPMDCRLLEMPCYCDGSSLAGDDLGKRWERSGRDDEVIWAELEDWYAARLAPKGGSS